MAVDLSTALLLVLVCGVACRQQHSQTAPKAEQVHPTYDKSGVLAKLEADADHDGRIDTWGYMEGARVLRGEIDENGDGTVDRWEYHRSRQSPVASPRSGMASQVRQAGQAAQAATLRRVGRGGLESPDKTLERIERATRHDGVVSRWEYFDNGVLTRIDTDTNGDGAIDKWETYNADSLSMMAIDTERRGKPDRRLTYRPDGTLDRIEIDPTGSGNFHPLPVRPAK